MKYYWNIKNNYIYVGDMQEGDRLATPEEIENHLHPKPTIKDYEHAVDEFIDKKAEENGFDSIMTCAKYIGFENSFKAHAEALLIWNSKCWEKCHEIINTYSKENPPSIEEVIKMMPEFVYEK